MRYKTALEQVKQILNSYKDIVDNMEREQIAETERTNKKCEEMRGQWTEQYIEEYRKQNTPAADSKRRAMQAARERAKALCDRNMETIRGGIDGYFSAPISADFARKIQSFSILGVALSDAEFDLLEREARTYTERRLLKQLAESRTEKRMRVEIDEHGQTKTVEREEPAAKKSIELPNIDVIYAAVEAYENNVNKFLENYAGENGGLLESLNLDLFGKQSHNLMLSVSSGSFLKNGDTEKIIEMLSEFENGSRKQALSDFEQSIIDAIIDDDDKKYPSLIPEKVQNVTKNNKELADLFILDERYSKYVKVGG
ncbi:MAG: hypothetical protein J5935_03770 [Lachnospiraceae bacterium]|nr:hypothetical protein [Lachnospiraceae bacterium]